MDLKSYIEALRKRWWLPVLFCALAFAGALAFTVLSPSEPSARTSVLLFTSDVNISRPDTFMDNQISTFVGLAKSPEVADKVAETLGDGSNPSQLRSDLATEAKPNDSRVVLTYTDESPARAEELVTLFRDTTIDAFNATLEVPAQRNIDRLQTQIDELVKELDEKESAIAGKLRDLGLDSSERFDTAGISDSALRALIRDRDLLVKRLESLQGQLDEALSAQQASVNTVQIQALGEPRLVEQSILSLIARFVLTGFLGLLLGAFIAVLADLLSKSVGSIEEAEALTGSNVLAAIPDLRESRPREKPRAGPKSAPRRGRSRGSDARVHDEAGRGTA